MLRMSGVSLPPFDLTLNKSLFQDKLRDPAGTKKHTVPLLSTEQISLLLSLLAIGVYQKAEAQGTEAELIITAQNNFGEVTQLILSGGKLYILTGGCELQFVRVATPADLAAISALSPLSLPEAGLDIYLVSAADMAGADTLTGESGTDKFELELDDGERAADIITDFTTNDRLVLTNPDRTNNPSITDYGSLADLLEAASLRLEADSTDTDDLNIIYNPDPDNQADEVVLVLDEFLATNDLDDITLTQIELL